MVVQLMGNRYFTDEEVKLLQSNPYVKKVTKKSIAYSEEFKQLFIDDYENGMSPSSIFKKYGFDLNVWMKIVEEVLQDE